MRDNPLDQREKGLEEAFFRKHNRDLLEKLRRKTDEASRREQLISLSGISDQSLLDKLVAAGLDAGSLAALGLVPLLQVAWADGKVQPQEREALLEAAKERQPGARQRRVRAPDRLVRSRARAGAVRRCGRSTCGRYAER